MLPLFKKEENDCENDFERWIYILKNMSTFERMPFLAREGREEGRESRNIEIAKMMISEKEPIAKIMAYTGLSEKEIQSLN